MAQTATVETESPPDVRGPTAPLPLSLFIGGMAALGSVLGGVILVQLAYAFWGGPVTQRCIDEGLDPEKITGALGVCHIVEAMHSPATTFLLYAGLILGLVVAIAGFALQGRMPTKRMKEHCIAGAVLGAQAIAFAAVLLVFREGNFTNFARNFLNIAILEGSLSGFIRGIKNTLILAFLGELGGVILGLVLAVLALSKRRVVRAPARVYVNFFRGTPLLWQLTMASALFLFGFRLRWDAFNIAILVFSLNTAAYAAEVFRAGIQSIERGQMEAARSLGMTYMQAMRYAIVPQAVRRVIPPLMNEFVILIKDTSLILVLGLALEDLDIYNYSRQGYSDSFNATYFVAAAIGYLVITLPLIRIVNAVERRLRSGLTGIVG